MVLPNFAAVVHAILLSAKYRRVLDVRRDELIRYFKKSISLGVCYVGLGSKKSVAEAWRAGEAAFFCCAYDVVTDWRRFDPRMQSAFQAILSRRVSHPQYELAMNLYEREKNNHLLDDGLERGPIALKFALELMGCRSTQEHIWGGLDNIGKLLQILDDVFDYEQDLQQGETNCLTSERGCFYLQELLLQFDPSRLHILFGNPPPTLSHVITKGCEKAKILLNRIANSHREISISDTSSRSYIAHYIPK
jgi:hypothetical protein